jgi:hypothetical protein
LRPDRCRACTPCPDVFGDEIPIARMLMVLAVLMALMEGEALRATPWHSPLYLWPAPVWLLWYLCNHALASAADGDRADQEPATMPAA